MKKLLAGGTLAVLAFGGLVATAAPASAHTPKVIDDCGSVSVNLTAYRGADLTVVIDGVTVEETRFDNAFTKTYEVSRDAVHEWSVAVVADDTTQYKNYDFQDSGATEACEAPPAEIAVPVVPEIVTGCAPSLDDVILPGNTEAIVYTKVEAGIVATLTSDAYTFPTDLADLSGFTVQADGSLLLPAELVLVQEECEEPTTEPTAPAAEPTDEPTEEASVAPVAKPSASASPVAEAAEEPPVLAATGATVGGAIAFAALLAAGGIALVWARKRMQNA